MSENTTFVPASEILASNNAIASTAPRGIVFLTEEPGKDEYDYRKIDNLNLLKVVNPVLVCAPSTYYGEKHFRLYMKFDPLPGKTKHQMVFLHRVAL